MKMVDRRRMDELWEEIVGVQMSLTGRLGKCLLRWAGHLVRMGEERMAKRADGLREQGRRKRGRPWLRWENCVRMDISKVGVVGEWRVESGESWLRIEGSGGVLWSRQGRSLVPLDLTPYKRKRRRRIIFCQVFVIPCEEL